jgi:hypothetical protein
MPDEGSEYKVTLKDVHQEVSGKLDAISGALQALTSAVTKDITELKVRVGHLEDAAVRKVSVYSPWIGVLGAIVAALIAYFHH